MLYNQNWDKTAQVSLAGFIAWLEQQNPAGKYEYFPLRTCAIGQYLRSVRVDAGDYVCSGSQAFTQIQSWNIGITYPHPWTFGAALERAREYMAAQS